MYSEVPEKFSHFRGAVLSRSSTALLLGICCAIARQARLSDEWFSSWPGLPRPFEENSYSIPERRLEADREGEKDIRGEGGGGGREESKGRKGKGNEQKRDQRVHRIMRINVSSNSLSFCR